MRLRLIVSVLATAFPAYVLAGGIVPDGGTATTVSTAGNGDPGRQLPDESAQ